jgi:hypothetical protein
MCKRKALLAYNASMTNQTLIEISLRVHFRTDIVLIPGHTLAGLGQGKKPKSTAGPSGHGSSLNRTNLKPRTGAVRPIFQAQTLDFQSRLGRTARVGLPMPEPPMPRY